MPYLSCKKIENDVYNFPTWQYCKYKDIFDSRIIINSTAKFYISISYQKDLLSIDTRIFTPSNKDTVNSLMKQLKNPPEEYKDAYEALSKFYDAYISLTNLATDPTGSLQTFSQNFNDADNETLNCYNALKMYLEE